jgi:hypothetical protein
MNTTHRSKAYRFTFDAQDFNGWERLARFRETIKANNQILRDAGAQTLRVCVKPRLGKKNPFARQYLGNFYTVKMIHGRRVDVYLHKR